MSGRRSGVPVGALVVLVIVVAVLAIERLWLSRIFWLLHAGAFVFIPLALIAIGIAIAYLFEGARAVGVLVTIAALGFGVWSVATNGYRTAQVYLDSVEIVDDPPRTYDERAAFVVAKAQAATNLDIRGEIVDTSYAPGQDRYTSLVTRPGTWSSWAGYAGVLSQDVALTGQATGGSCEVDERSGLRLNGFFAHSLERAIIQQRFGAVITDTDAYGLCVEDEDGEVRPLIVVPIKSLQGILPAVEVPAGVAVYDGASGDLDILTEVEAGELDGMVFPISIAENMREATAATGSWWEHVTGRNGYEDTSRDETDPNGANRAEFLLGRSAGDRFDYVTPLTLRGRNVSIGAVSDVPADEVIAGELPTLTIHDLEVSRVSNTAVADRLRTDYSDLPDWASGLQIFEITPISGEEWVASLGQQQNVAYRVVINVDGSSCLETAEGEQIRCGRATATDGNGPGVDLSDADDGEPVTLPADPSELDELTNEELARLQEQVAEEIAERLTTGP